MKGSVLKWTRYAGAVVAWLTAGIVVLALFAGTLWASGGSFSGYPALIVPLAASLAIGWWAARRSASTSGLLLRLLPVAASLLVVLWAMVPLAPGVLDEPAEGTHFEEWDLGGGRAVSVSHHRPPEEGGAREQALLFVHGGPGAYVRDFDRSFWAGFAGEGFDVFTYDQIGAGRSGIVDVTEYSHDASVSDLAAVVDRIDRPIVLVGQSYGAAVVASYLDSDHRRSADNSPVSHVVLVEPSPLPGGRPAEDDPHYMEKTTRAPSIDGPGPVELIDSPRFLLAMMLPVGNRFVGQEELIGHLGAGVQDRIVAASFCREDADAVPDFRNLPINIMANRSIMNSLWESDRPELTDLDLPVLLLLGECSYVPRGFAMDYFEVVPIDRSHVIPGVGHVVWGDEDGRRLTQLAVMSFLENRDPPLPIEPGFDSRLSFVEQGR